MEIVIPYMVKKHPETCMNNARLGMWLFLASEVMLFGALFSTYVILRTGSAAWPHGSDILNVPLATVNTIVLLVSSITMGLATRSLAKGKVAAFKRYFLLTIALGLTFLVIKSVEYGMKFEHHLYPETNTFLAIYFVMTGLHVLHVIGGLVVNLYHIFPGFKLFAKDPDHYVSRVQQSALYWYFVDLVWIAVFGTLYLL